MSALKGRGGQTRSDLPSCRTAQIQRIVLALHSPPSNAGHRPWTTASVISVFKISKKSQNHPYFQIRCTGTTMLEASAATVVAKLASGKARASARSECATTAGPPEDDATATAGGTCGYSRTSSSATVDIKICRQQRQFTNDAEVAESAGIPSSDTPLPNEIPGRTPSSSVGADMGAGDEAVIATAPHISPPSPKLIIKNADQPRPRPSSTPTPTLPCPPPNEHAPNSPTVAPVATGTVGAAASAMARSKPALVEGKINSLIRK